MRKPILSAAIAALLLATTLWLWRVSAAGDPGGPTRQWFYDLNTRELFPAPMGATPPIAAPSDKEGGTSGVLAIVVLTPRGREIAYLMSQGQSAGAGSSPEAWVRLPDGGEWMPERSPRAEAILGRVRDLCGDGPPLRDFPPEP